MQTAKKPLLQVKNLTVTFSSPESKSRAVNKLSYDLYEGEKLGIVGESGSGKSVSSLQIMQLFQKDSDTSVSGAVEYHGQDLRILPERDMQKIRGNDISMIFQEPMTSLNPIKTCGKQIAEVYRKHNRLRKKEAMEQAVSIMKAVGIANPKLRARQYPHQLSGGMRQRIMIAMALACRPEILIADEPTTALDVTIQAQILDLIRNLNESNHTAVIMITHDLGVVSELCDRIIVMQTYMPEEMQEILLEKKRENSKAGFGNKNTYPV